ncbi:MAG: hypothetical protein H7287_11180 [Thermoleophilia bacterium]|nr:hypothetical protein [Thermoleophilia bacterium]
MSCATELLHPANFCPVCGARLAAPIPDGSTATNPAGETPSVMIVPDEATDNVSYLPSQSPAGAMPPNPHAFDYDGVAPPEAGPTGLQGPAGEPPIPLHPSVRPTQTSVGTEDEGYAARIAQQLSGHAASPELTLVDPIILDAYVPPAPAGPTPVASIPEAAHSTTPLDRQPTEVDSTLADRSAWDPPEAFGSHGAVPTPAELVPLEPVDDNPFGDFFSDGPSAWLEDEVGDDDSVEHTHTRVKGTLLALGAIAFGAVAWGWFTAAMVRGSGGAEAGGFVLVAMVLWLIYLSLDRTDQHAPLLRIDRRVASLLDRSVDPLQARTTGSIVMRRERDRYRAMRDERTRRIEALGEGAYRSFRRGQLPEELQTNAQRVLAMERQMMLQDRKIHEMVAERDRPDAGSLGATEPTHDGHPPA